MCPLSVHTDPSVPSVPEGPQPSALCLSIQLEYSLACSLLSETVSSKSESETWFHIPKVVYASSLVPTTTVCSSISFSSLIPDSPSSCPQGAWPCLLCSLHCLQTAPGLTQWAFVNVYRRRAMQRSGANMSSPEDLRLGARCRRPIRLRGQVQKTLQTHSGARCRRPIRARGQVLVFWQKKCMLHPGNK